VSGEGRTRKNALIPELCGGGKKRKKEKNRKGEDVKKEKKKREDFTLSLKKKKKRWRDILRHRGRKGKTRDILGKEKRFLPFPFSTGRWGEKRRKGGRGGPLPFKREKERKKREGRDIWEKEKKGGFSDR